MTHQGVAPQAELIAAKEPGKTVAGWASLISATLFISTSALPIRHVTLPTAALVFWSRLISTAATVLWQRWEARRAAPLARFDRRTLSALTAIGALTAAEQLMFTSAIRTASVATVMFAVYLFPIYTMLLAHQLLKEPIPAKTIAAMLVAFGGTGVMVLGAESMPVGNELLGLGLGSLAAIVVAGRRVLINQVDARVPTPLIMVAEGACSLAVLGPIFLFTARVLPAGSDGLWVIGYGVLYGLCSRAFMLTGLRRVAVVPAAVVGYLEPIAATVMARLLLGEPLRPNMLVGGGFVLLGSASALLSLPRNRIAVYPNVR